MYSAIGGLYKQVNRLEEASSAFEQMLAIRRRLAERNPAKYDELVASGLSTAGDLYSDLNKLDTAEKMYSEPYLRKNRRAFPLLARFTKPANYDRFLRNARAILEFDLRGELEKISCPTLILAGSEDETVGNEAAYELNRAIACSELFVYDGLGHGAFEEAKDFYDRVFSFCSR